MTMRRRLGTVYVKSPAQLFEKWITENFFKVIMAILCSVLWLFVLYCFVGIVRFLGVNLAHIWDETVTLSWIYNHPFCVPFKVIGVIFMVLYVFRDKTNKRG